MSWSLPPAKPAAKPAMKVVSGAAGRTIECAASAATSNTWSTSIRASTPNADNSSAVQDSRSIASFMAILISCCDPRACHAQIVPRVNIEYGSRVEFQRGQSQGRHQPSYRRVGPRRTPRQRRLQTFAAHFAQQILGPPIGIDCDDAVGVDRHADQLLNRM